MKYTDVYFHTLLFKLKSINASLNINKVRLKLVDEAIFYLSLFDIYIINGEYEKAREVGECIDNILSCLN